MKTKFTYIILNTNFNHSFWDFNKLL